MPFLGTGFTVPASQCQYVGLKSTCWSRETFLPSVRSKTCPQWFTQQSSRMLLWVGVSLLLQMGRRTLWHLNTHNLTQEAEAPELQGHSHFVGSPFLWLMFSLGKLGNTKSLCLQDIKSNDNKQAMMQND